MEPISLRTKDGKIWIEQADMGDESAVLLDPAQVPTLIQWLEEALVELSPQKQPSPTPRKNVAGLQ